MKEQTHHQGLAYGAEARQHFVIQTSEMFVLERGDDRIGKGDGARLDRVARKFPALNKNFGKHVEGVLDVTTFTFLEVRGDKSVMNLMQCSR